MSLVNDVEKLLLLPFFLTKTTSIIDNTSTFKIYFFSEQTVILLIVHVSDKKLNFQIGVFNVPLSYCYSFLFAEYSWLLDNLRMV